ncbi:hypothetical protein N24_2240 [Corynebacterium suranareeae]|uniref:Uncharacterized protein n=1 Tax=Corynebacterium suranareeae TaxID=2506452 RepID=A0A169S0L0_9CORY|nr:hypothetical protein N24_2240 [Corynebacterium suranareeae]
MAANKPKTLNLLIKLLEFWILEICLNSKWGKVGTLGGRKWGLILTAPAPKYQPDFMTPRPSTFLTTRGFNYRLLRPGKYLRHPFTRRGRRGLETTLMRSLLTPIARSYASLHLVTKNAYPRKASGHTERFPALPTSPGDQKPLIPSWVWPYTTVLKNSPQDPAPS